MSDEMVLVPKASVLKLCKLTILAARTYQPVTPAGECLRDELVVWAENLRGPIDIAEAGDLIEKRFRNLKEK